MDSRCVLAVRDLQASTRFYIDVLGFRRDFGDGFDGWNVLRSERQQCLLPAGGGDELNLEPVRLIDLDDRSEVSSAQAMLRQVATKNDGVQLF